MGARTLLNAPGQHLRVQPGDRIGLVGRNGAGKTTTMRILAGEGEPYGGTVTRSGEMGYLPQDSKEGDIEQTARDRADDGARGARAAALARLIFGAGAIAVTPVVPVGMIGPAIAMRIRGGRGQNSAADHRQRGRRQGQGLHHGVTPDTVFRSAVPSAVGLLLGDSR